MKVLLINKQNPARSRFMNAGELASFLWGRRLTNYTIALVRPNGSRDRIVPIHSGDVNVIAENVTTALNYERGVKDDLHIAFCEASDTLRQMPGNNLLAVKDKERNRWMLDFDAAADDVIIEETSKLLARESFAWYHKGEELAEELNVRIGAVL